MTTDPQLERIVRSWLEPGLTTLTNDVLDPVLDQLPATPQRRRWSARRVRHVGSFAKFSLAAAAVVIVAIVGINLASRSDPPIVGTTATSTPSVPPSGTAASPAPVESASLAPVESRSPLQSPSLPALNLPGTRASPAGQYGFDSVLRASTGMHKFKEDGQGSREVADLTFSVLCDATAWDEPTQQVNVADFDAVYAEPYEPPVTFTGPDGDETTRAYALAVGERTLCVFLTWHETTTDEERAALLQIVETIRAEHIKNGRLDFVRVIFELDEGWDVG
jgi:hypothetical protein